MIRIYTLESANNADVYITLATSRQDVFPKACKKVEGFFSTICHELLDGGCGKSTIKASSLTGSTISTHDSFKEAAKAGFEAITVGFNECTSQELFDIYDAVVVSGKAVSFEPKDAFGEAVSVEIYNIEDGDSLPNWSQTTLYSEYSKDDHKEVIEYANKIKEAAIDAGRSFNIEAFTELVDNLHSSIS